MQTAIDLIGNRYNRLLVTDRAVNKPYGTPAWLCLCDCGRKTVVTGKSLRGGRTKSCGCLQQEVRKNGSRMIKHGHTVNAHHSPTYRSWSHMRQRCDNTKNDRYESYGGRGIIVCERWKSFINFLADMGKRPSGTSIDRHPDNKGNYEPDNCRWATSKEQRANRRAA